MSLRSIIALSACCIILTTWILLAGEVDRYVALNTLLLGTATNLVSIPLGVLVAVTCLGRDGWGRATLFVCLTLIFVPLFVHVSAWDAAFGKLGWLTGISAFGSGSMGPWTMAIWIHALAAIPQVSVIVWLGLRLSGRVHEERATLDASALSVFRYITLPKLAPLIGLAVIWNFVVCSREIAVTDIYRIGTLAEQIYLGYSLSDFDAMSGASTTVVLIACLATVVFVAILPSVQSETNSSDLMAPSKQQNASKTIKATSTLILAILIVAPTINLLARASRSVEIVDNQPIVSYSIQNLASVITRVPATFADEFCWSATIAATSTALLLVLGALLVWRASSSRVWQLILIGAVAVSCSLPGPLIGSGLLEIRSSIGAGTIQWLFDRTIFGPVLANSIFCFPISVVLIWFVFQNVAHDAVESMSIEGANAWTRFVQLVLIANWKMFAGAAVIIFTICFGELSATQLAVPPGMDTIPRRMLGLLHSGVNDHTAGLTIVSVCLIILLISIGFRLFFWSRFIHEE